MHVEGGRAAVLLVADVAGLAGVDSVGWQHLLLDSGGGGHAGGHAQVQGFTLLRGRGPGTAAAAARGAGPRAGAGGGGRGAVAGGRAAAPALQSRGHGATAGLECWSVQQVGGRAVLGWLLGLLLDAARREVGSCVRRGLEMEGDEGDRSTLHGQVLTLVLETHGQDLQSPSHHLKLGVVG